VDPWAGVARRGGGGRREDRLAAAAEKTVAAALAVKRREQLTLAEVVAGVRALGELAEALAAVSDHLAEIGPVRPPP